MMILRLMITHDGSESYRQTHPAV